MHLAASTGRKAGLILGALQQELLRGAKGVVLRLPVWRDIGPVPTLLDFENKLLSQVRYSKGTEISPRVRRFLASANPTLAMPGALHVLTDEGEQLTLLKAKGTERLTGLFEGTEGSAIASESFVHFSATLSEFCATLEIQHLIIAIEPRGTSDLRLVRFVKELGVACPWAILVTVGDRSSAALATWIQADVPDLSHRESDAVVASFGLSRPFAPIIWKRAHGHPLNTMLACELATRGETIPDQPATTGALLGKLWLGLDRRSRQLLSALAAVNIDVSKESLCQSVEAPPDRCQEDLRHLVASGTVDLISLMQGGEPSYAIEPEVLKEAVRLAGEEAVKLASRAGHHVLTDTITSPYENPKDVVRCVSYLQETHQGGSLADAAIATSPIMLSWGETTQVRKNLRTASNLAGLGHRQAYIDYFLGLADVAEGNYRGAQKHLRGALTQLEQQDGGLGLSIALRHALSRSLDRLGRTEEAISIMRRAAMIAETHVVRKEFPGLLSSSLANLGVLLRKAGKLPDAQAAYQAALEIDEGTANVTGLAEDHRGLAFIHQDLGNLEEAVRHHEQALELDVTGSSLVGQAIDHANLGAIQLALGHEEQARQHLGWALQLFRQLGAQSEATQVEGLLRGMSGDRDASERH